MWFFIVSALTTMSLMLLTACNSDSNASSEKENAELSKEASGLRVAVATYRDELANLRSENEALSNSSVDENSARIIAELEEQLTRATEDNKELLSELARRETALKAESQGNSESRPAAPVNLSTFSEPEVISDLCYLSSMLAFATSGIASNLVPDITPERLNAAMVEVGDMYGNLYPPTRDAAYMSLTKWTYCTIPYFDEAHHERMRQLASGRVDALEK